jgi:hypothetical protein
MPPASPDTTFAADRIEQRSLAVVDVTHDGHDRRTRLEVFRRVRRIEQAFDNVGGRHALDGVAHFFGDQLCGVGIDEVGDQLHLALLHQELDHIDPALGHACGEFLNRDRFRDDDFAAAALRRLKARW